MEGQTQQLTLFVFYCAVVFICSVLVLGHESDLQSLKAGNAKIDYEADEADAPPVNYKLTIFPEPESGGIILVRRIDESLSLSCQIIRAGEGPSIKFRLEWRLPLNAVNRVNRMNTTVPSQVTLMIKQLQESDTGSYECVALNEVHNLRKKVFIRIQGPPRKSKIVTYCGENQFECSPRVCINRRYICDGVDDCLGGAEDEDLLLCGGPPCDGKLYCDDGRCMPPHYCCDKRLEPNCSMGYQNPCCSKLYRNVPLHTQQHFNDIGFLQSTMYTIVGCAIAFVIIVTITVVAVCRVHMKRSHFVAMASACRASRTHPLSRTGPPTWTDLDAYLSATSEFYRHGHGNRAPLADENNSALLVTYNINNGVQFVGRPVDPPPYCEAVNAPRREEPPPPYASRDNLHTLQPPAASQARYLQPNSAFSTIISLLSGGGAGGGGSSASRHPSSLHPQEDSERQDLLQGAAIAAHGDNNNGDINGNSTEQVRVQPNGNSGQNQSTQHRLPSTAIAVEDPRRLSTLYVSFHRPPSPSTQQ